LSIAVSGKIRDLKRRLGSAYHLRDQGREFLFELRMVSGRMETQRSGPGSQADPAAIEIDLEQRGGARLRLGEQPGAELTPLLAHGRRPFALSAATTSS
jgi:hypothetical protein